MEPLINYFKDIETRSVLDVGTGRGRFLSVLHKVFPEARITAVDPDTSSLEIARRDYPGVNFFEMEAEHLNFEDHSFDVASLSMVLHHLPGVKKGLKEVRRVVKPNGFIIIQENISDNLTAAQEVHKMYHHFRSRIDRLQETFHRKTFSKDAVLQQLKEAELPVQFFFELRRNVNLVENEEDLDLRVENMRQMLEGIRDKPEYETLKPQIEAFRERAVRYGFQPATNLVVVIRKR